MNGPNPPLVALLAMAMVLSSAGCIEVKDRPERGEFTIGLRLPPVIMVNSTGGQLHGPEAKLLTDLKNKTLDYHWSLQSPLAVFPPIFMDSKGRDLQLNDTPPGITVAKYGVGYYGARQNVTLFLASVPAGMDGALAVADVDYLNTSYSPATPKPPELRVEPTGDFKEVAHYRVGQMMDLTPNLLGNVSFDVYYSNLTAGRHAYVMAYEPRATPDMGPIVVALYFQPGEMHSFTIDSTGGVNITIWNTSGSWEIEYSGPVSGLPKDRRVELGVLAWDGKVGGGKEKAPDPGAVLATASLIGVAALLIARRRARGPRYSDSVMRRSMVAEARRFHPGP